MVEFQRMYVRLAFDNNVGHFRLRLVDNFLNNVNYVLIDDIPMMEVYHVVNMGKLRILALKMNNRFVDHLNFGNHIFKKNN